MINLNVSLEERSYPIYIAVDYQDISKVIDRIKPSKIIVVTDDNVDKYQAESAIKAMVDGGYDVNKFVIRSGEESKNLDTIRSIYEYLTDLKCDRKSLLIALGGGVTGDITGFAASSYLRGINFLQIPTTLLAQADSSVGGKTGVDFKGNKNIIGAFYQPKAVYINVNSLKTLPKREYIAGLAEIIKHGIIYDYEFFNYLENNTEKILERREDVLQYMAKVNCTIKKTVVEEDERENGLRAILNFGHTIGHAIESFMGFELPHGECISLGFIGACRISEKFDMINESVTKRIENLLKEFGLPVAINKLDVDLIYNQLFYDKKVNNKRLKFILLKKIGEVIQVNIDDEKIIKNAIRSLIK